MRTTTQTRAQCDWDRTCETPATFLGAKGWLYCAEHREHRRGWESTRPLKRWEIERIESGRLLIGWRATQAQTAEYDAKREG